MIERREKLYKYIKENGDVSLSELFRLIPEVSEMTVRRDLEKLEQNAQIQRYRGGVRYLAGQSFLKEAAYTQRSAERTESKLIISKKALPLAGSARSIYIDSGTTCVQLAELLPDDNTFILTAAPIVAMKLISNSKTRVNLTGGELNRDTFALSGNNAISYVKTINIEFAFIGASACSTSSGFTCGDYQEAELKKLIIKKASRVACLMDISKLNYSMPYTFARPRDIDFLVVDQPLPESYRQLMQRSGVHVL